MSDAPNTGGIFLLDRGSGRELPGRRPQRPCQPLRQAQPINERGLRPPGRGRPWAFPGIGPFAESRCFVASLILRLGHMVLRWVLKCPEGPTSVYFWRPRSAFAFASAFASASGLGLWHPDHQTGARCVFCALIIRPVDIQGCFLPVRMTCGRPGTRTGPLPWLGVVSDWDFHHVRV